MWNTVNQIFYKISWSEYSRQKSFGDIQSANAFILLNALHRILASYFATSLKIKSQFKKIGIDYEDVRKNRVEITFDDARLLNLYPGNFVKNLKRDGIRLFHTVAYLVK